ncbi:hypothetical protein [Microbispora sp. ATCC PTA-5024]|uniref:hypothetical protein n=1 Tax=Microbispora sp. ATCC PTA-5024 TaxID=316330 RepID=UPI0003DB9CF8|nr:hypothetical protein [Microbispora sp. ATCC PTA-5024]ETK32234.1 hypothetical protein MPTA5024_30895 [Microbispora sp. ATCC PTA-5024]
MRDEYLLAALRMGAGADPVPGRVSAAARAAFALRLPGGVAADEVAVAVPPGARSAELPRQGGSAAPRLGAADGAPDAPGFHRFTAAGLTIDVETSVVEGRLEVAGQISPWPGPDARVEVRTPHVGKVRSPSGSGHFAVSGLPPGWVSVVCHRPGLPPVFTRWVHVRP